ncbi:Uma2 family endonuclease [Streptomyces sp. NPDC048172]|uniref:Uma2 family endonuclease n=1 Tax=Streptomyces sp. NPDC048172 TaxID=3365505 RepID=UPI003722140D
MPPRTELIDGALVFAAQRGKWHSRVTSLLAAELDSQAPAELRADRQMTVKLAKRQAPEPDVLVDIDLTAVGRRALRP